MHETTDEMNPCMEISSDDIIEFIAQYQTWKLQEFIPDTVDTRDTTETNFSLCRGLLLLLVLRNRTILIYFDLGQFGFQLIYWPRMGQDSKYSELA